MSDTVQDLAHLQQDLLDMGDLVETMLLDAVNQLQRCDLQGLERLGELLQQVQHRRLEIEMACLRLIATTNPADVDLRLAVALTEIATDLERVGELAESIARVNSLALEHHLRPSLVNIQRLAGEVLAMLNRALIALAQRDLETAHKLHQDASQVNALHASAFKELLTSMNGRPRVASQAVYLSRAAYNLKRAADRIAGTGDWIVFAITGVMDRDTEAPPIVLPFNQPNPSPSMVV